VSALLQLGLSRNREFDADLAAAELTGDPGGLAMALERLEQAQLSVFDRLFRRRRHDAQPSMLRTHPASRERVQRLLEMAREPPPAAVVEGVLPLLPGAWPEVTRPPRRRWTGVRF
ncbi:MAG: M48 family metalloprotease, partial [bacterium]